MIIITRLLIFVFLFNKSKLSESLYKKNEHVRRARNAQHEQLLDV